MLSSLSKSRISIFNAHLTLLVRRMTSHNSIGKYRHLVKTWNFPWNGASPVQTRLVDRCRTVIDLEVVMVSLLKDPR